MDLLAAALEKLAVQQVMARQQTKINKYFGIAPEQQTAKDKTAAEGVMPVRFAAAAAELVDLASEEDAADADSLGDKDAADGTAGAAAPAAGSEPAANAAGPAPMEQ